MHRRTKVKFVCFLFLPNKIFTSFDKFERFISVKPELCHIVEPVLHFI